MAPASGPRDMLSSKRDSAFHWGQDNEEQQDSEQLGKDIERLCHQQHTHFDNTFFLIF